MVLGKTPLLTNELITHSYGGEELSNQLPDMNIETQSPYLLLLLFTLVCQLVLLCCKKKIKNNVSIVKALRIAVIDNFTNVYNIIFIIFLILNNVIWVIIHFWSIGADEINGNHLTWFAVTGH